MIMRSTGLRVTWHDSHVERISWLSLFRTEVCNVSLRLFTKSSHQGIWVSPRVLPTFSQPTNQKAGVKNYWDPLADLCIANSDLVSYFSMVVRETWLALLVNHDYKLLKKSLLIAWSWALWLTCHMACLPC